MMATRALALSLLLAGLVVFACDGGGEARPTVQKATATPTGLVTYDPSTPLMVEGRNNLQVCLEVLDGSVSDDDAATLLSQALKDIETDARWPVGFGEAEVSNGCPLPPVALDTSVPVWSNRNICTPEVSPFFVSVFIGSPDRFSERFPEDLIEVVRMRTAGHEYISTPESRCYRQVGEAWYLTPDELHDTDLLTNYVFNIFNIKEVCC